MKYYTRCTMIVLIGQARCLHTGVLITLIHKLVHIIPMTKRIGNRVYQGRPWRYRINKVIKLKNKLLWRTDSQLSESVIHVWKYFLWAMCVVLKKIEREYATLWNISDSNKHIERMITKFKGVLKTQWKYFNAIDLTCTY